MKELIVKRGKDVTLVTEKVYDSVSCLVCGETTDRQTYNLPIFDKAVTLIEANPRKFMDLPSGETMSYREYNAGKPHKLVMLPGYRADDTSFSV